MPSPFPFEQLQTLRKFPTYSSSNKSPLKDGRYVIAYVEEAFATGEPNSDQVNSTIWFQSPPLDEMTIRKIDRIQLVAQSHDQGFADDPLAGNWTWFEFAILESPTSLSPRNKDGIELVWMSHFNRHLTSTYDWAEGETFDENHDLLRLLNPGNVIAIRLCARFPGWEIFAKDGYLVIDIGDDRDLMPLGYGPIVSEIKNLQQIITEVNDQILSGVENKPSLSENFFRADNFISSTDTERPLRVLALDGGGARGLASLFLLKAVMDKISPSKRPCEVFDMIGGTSTGGLIAIMLGRLGMTVQECIDEYQNVMKKVFVPPKLGKTVAALKDGEAYSSDTLEAIIKDLIRRKIGNDDEQLLVEENSSRNCKVFVMAAREDAANNRGPVFLRSYLNVQELSPFPDIKIWEAARATSAAPSYFKSQKIGRYNLIDGGLGANNPLGWLWYEIFKVFGPNRATDCFLSIGTGIPANQPLKISVKDIGGTMSAISSIATNTELVNILFRPLIDAYAPKAQRSKYWRLNVGKFIGDWDKINKGYLWNTVEKRYDDYKDPGEMDDLKAIPALLDMTRDCIREQDDSIKQCAARLMETLH